VGELDITTSGAPGRPLGLSGSPGEDARLTTVLSARGCLNATLTVTGSDVLVDRLGVSSDRRECLRAVHVRGQWLFEDYQTKRATVSNCDLSEAGSNGLLVAAPGSRVHRNRIHHNGKYVSAALSLIGQGITATSNRVHDNLGAGIAAEGRESNETLGPTVVAGNVVWSNGNAGAADAVGIVAGVNEWDLLETQTAHPMVVHSNVSCGNAAAGYRHAGRAGPAFEGNVSCFNPVGFAASGAGVLVRLSGNASVEDAVAREVMPGVVSGGNTWHRRDGAVTFSLDGKLLGLDEIRTRAGQELGSAASAPHFAGGVPERFEPDLLAAWDSCGPSTPGLCGKR
jgi:hypothetical protein